MKILMKSCYLLMLNENIVFSSRKNLASKKNLWIFYILFCIAILPSMCVLSLHKFLRKWINKLAWEINIGVVKYWLILLDSISHPWKIISVAKCPFQKTAFKCIFQTKLCIRSAHIQVPGRSFYSNPTIRVFCLNASCRQILSQNFESKLWLKIKNNWKITSKSNIQIDSWTTDGILQNAKPQTDSLNFWFHRQIPEPLLPSFGEKGIIKSVWECQPKARPSERKSWFLYIRQIWQPRLSYFQPVNRSIPLHNKMSLDSTNKIINNIFEPGAQENPLLHQSYLKNPQPY